MCEKSNITVLIKNTAFVVDKKRKCWFGWFRRLPSHGRDYWFESGMSKICNDYILRFFMWVLFCFVIEASFFVLLKKLC